VPDTWHGGRGRAAGIHCLHQRSAAEPPTVWWGRRETRHPQGAEEEKPGLQGRKEKTAKEEKIPTVSPVHYHGERMISGEQDGQVNIESMFREGSVVLHGDMAA